MGGVQGWGAATDLLSRPPFLSLLQHQATTITRRCIPQPHPPGLGPGRPRPRGPRALLGPLGLRRRGRRSLGLGLACPSPLGGRGAT